MLSKFIPTFTLMWAVFVILLCTLGHKHFKDELSVSLRFMLAARQERAC